MLPSAYRMTGGTGGGHKGTRSGSFHSDDGVAWNPLKALHKSTFFGAQYAS